MDAMNILTAFAALAFVLALIGLFGLLLRRFGPMAGIPVRKGAERRLSVVEVLPIDARRRLVLVRRDDVEHLLLLGAGDDLVVEMGIRSIGRTVVQDGSPGGFADALSRAGSPTPSAPPTP